MVAERILVTGSTGTTGRLLANLLRGRGAEVAAATRRVERAGQVRFDWSDPASFAATLNGVDAAYVVAPTDRVDQLPVMRPFLELAAERLPGAIVLLSAASLPPGGPMMGAAHAWLRDHSPHWAALRPSWLMQNFTGQYLPSIIDEGRLYSATGDGRVPFIDAADIAAVAAAALLTPEATSGELILTGPEALTYDQAASAIAEVIGRPVRHCRLSVEALAEWQEGASCGAERQTVRSLQHQELGRRPTPTCHSGQGGAPVKGMWPSRQPDGASHRASNQRRSDVACPLIPRTLPSG